MEARIIRGEVIVESGLMSVKDKVYYWTERFDRESVDGKIRRLHQEDFCQITGTPGELKYESEGGPSFAACMAAMWWFRDTLLSQKK